MKSGKRCLLSIVLPVVLLAALSLSLKVDAKQIFTKDDEVNAAVGIILDRCTTPGMTKKEKLRESYLYLVENMKYTHGHRSKKIHVSKKQLRAMKKKTNELKEKNEVKFSSKFRSRYRHVLTLSGTCYDMSAVFCIVANHIGYKAGLCSGEYVRSNGSSVEHWWNYVKINGEKRYFDVQAANAMKRKKFSYYCKKKNSKTWKKHHSD